MKTVKGKGKTPSPHRRAHISQKEIVFKADKTIGDKWGTSKRHAGIVKGRELDLDFLKEFDREYQKSKNESDSND